MKTLKALGGGLSVAALTLVSSIAHAELTGNIGIASEYVFRGLPSSGNGAAVSGGLDWSKDNIYAGTWLSNVGDQGTGNEVDVYVGMNAGNLDIGGIAYLFPGDPGLKGGVNRIVEAYAGYNSGIFSGYVWYGIDTYPETDDDYVYLEANLNAPLNDGIEVGFHLGYTIFVGDDYDDNGPRPTDDQVDLGVTASYGGLWMSVTSILDNDTSLGEYQRPRVNIGYTWNFDKLPMPSLRSM